LLARKNNIDQLDHTASRSIESTNYETFANGEASIKLDTFKEPPKTLGLGIKLPSVAMVCSDLIACTIAFAVAAVVITLGQTYAGHVPDHPLELLRARGGELALLTSLLIAIFSFGGLYKSHNWEREEIAKIVQALGLVAVFDGALLYIVGRSWPELWFLIAWPLAAITVISARMLVRSVPVVRRSMTTHILLIGSGISVEEFAMNTRGSRSGPIQVLENIPIDRLVALDPDTLAYNLTVLSSAHNSADGRIGVVIVPSTEEYAYAQNLINRLREISWPFSVSVPFEGLAVKGLKLKSIVGADIIFAEVEREKKRPLDSLCKRATDILISAIALILLAPVIALISILLMSEGSPILFKQVRIGIGGRRFNCLKFRTMRPNAEIVLTKLLLENAVMREQWMRYQKLENDPRITRIGRFLRYTSLDELPQLWNVLRGDMSIIGPRPIVAPEISGYAPDKAYFDSPNFVYYASCLPGITGLWQVSGRAKTTHAERMRLDRWYARNCSFSLDLIILFRTVRAILCGTGS
jgi:undecaprenyl-phosphate galactose phosphotransferase